jgi:hypothetical protein
MHGATPEVQLEQLRYVADLMETERANLLVVAEGTGHAAGVEDLDPQRRVSLVGKDEANEVEGLPGSALIVSTAAPRSGERAFSRSPPMREDR